MKRKIFIAADVDPIAVRLLEQDGRFEVRVEPSHAADVLARAIGDTEVLVTRYHNEVTRRVLESAPRLRAIVQGTSGLDNIDSAAATERSVTIVGIPGENANAVAEMVIGTMIALTRTLPSYDRMVRRGDWVRTDCAERREMRSHRVGIVGIGRVGTQVARIAGLFRMPVRAYDPYVPPEEIRSRGALPTSSLATLLGASDILTMHVPLTDETRRMIGGGEIEQLPQGAFLINTSRGEVLDTSALLGALSRNRLGGAALDVYETEPPTKTSWPDDPRLILTPHIAGCSRESKESIGRLIYVRTCQQLGFDPRTGE